MFPRFFRIVLAVTSSALIIPYTLAFMAEMLYGKPKRSAESVLKSLHPSRVFTFTKSLLRGLKSYRYVGLYLKWTKHYNNLSPEQVLKNIEYGHNHNTLDIYKPPKKQEHQAVLVFVYGGMWSSGDKNMYSLLCCTLANRLNALVICPNYSIYPKGYVDDMVQDISDVITWTREHASVYGGDPERVVLMGHSAGAHLVAMTTIELANKHLSCLPGLLQHKLQQLQPLTGGPLQLEHLDHSSCFLDTYFTDRCPVVHEDLLPQEDGKTSVEEDEKKPVEEHEKKPVEEDEKKLVEGDENGKEWDAEAGEMQGDAEESGKESFVMVSCQQEDYNSESSTYHALKSIKLVIGLAGVYDIGEQYRVQQRQAQEHTSYMTRAMYDTDHFSNFSPTLAIRHISPSFRLPPFWLLHGDNDTSVPLSSSLSFASALCARQAGGAHMGVLRGCDHYEVCLDLMQEQAKWHHCVLGEVFKAFRENSL